MTDTTGTLPVPLPHIASGKVRELFDAGEHLLMVATDRISVFDVVLPTPIPDKGAVLTGLSVFWFERTAPIVPNHLVEWRSRAFPGSVRLPDGLRGRAMLVRKARMLPIECVVRGYLAGSAWKDYQRDGSVSGVGLPAGLKEADKLPEPIFTPTTKAQSGHDVAIDIEQAGRLVGDPGLVRRMAELSLAVYEHGSRHAEAKGLILADTKLELGLVDGELTVCDELLTPDSSRYWPMDAWSPGAAPPSFDKQFVRDYTETLGWDHDPPGPQLPRDVVDGTRRRYRDAYERLTGRPIDDYLAEA